jgi:hypothetical protein
MTMTRPNYALQRSASARALPSRSGCNQGAIVAGTIVLAAPVDFRFDEGL